MAANRRERFALSLRTGSGKRATETPPSCADLTTYVDSHAHLADPAFDADRNAVLGRARLSGARAVVCIGESLAAAARAEELAAAHPAFVHFTAGIHPHDAATFDREHDLSSIRRAVTNGAVAIGECGLDYHYDHSPRSDQLRAFAAQLELAAELRRPVVVHSRLAEDDTRAAIADAAQSGVRGVLHCYTGSHALAEHALAAGWYVSFSGIVTFRKWTDDALIRLVPDDRLLAESDAPYLAPVPHRGKRNEPAYVTFTIAHLARARGADAATVGERVTRNAEDLFGLAASSRDRL
jgi:TatD DNase family protein